MSLEGRFPDLTDDEREVLNCTFALWQAVKRLPVEHEMERSEVATAIHHVQHWVASRHVWREE